MEENILTVESELEGPVGYEYPMLVKRIQAIFVDTLVILGLMLCMNALVEAFPGTPGWLRGVALYGFALLYEPLLSVFVCTLGQRLTGIRVRRADDPGRRINVFKSYVRFLVKLFLGWLSFVTIHFNPQKRALHDLASNTVMIRTGMRVEPTGLVE